LVPDSPDALTSNCGWNLVEEGERLIGIIQQLKEHQIRVSLFMDAVPHQMALAKKIGADRVELYTEPYATEFRERRVQTVFNDYVQAAEAAQFEGLGVNAGHDLNLENLRKFCLIPNILEVSIGHALIAEALEMGLSNTVKAYLDILAQI
jgi:pyridoxine 5-phosphate synthase